MDLPLTSPPGDAELRALIKKDATRWRFACWRITRDLALAEDAVQDALLNAWKSRAQFRGDAQLGTWIQGIAIRTAIDLMRKRGPLADDALPEDTMCDSPSPEHHQHRTQFGEELGRAMTRLTDIERMCFVLKHQEQWRLEEIAEHLGRSLDSIKQALLRAVRKLRADLGAWQENPHAH